MSHKSCLTNLLQFLEFVSNYVDEGVPVDEIYLHFKKAFDRVPHGRMLSKIKSLGIDLVAQWIGNWLHDRKQRVVINGTCSKWSGVSSGVPQGSVLGPILFIICIHDIDLDINGRILNFADDTKLFNYVGNPGDIACLRNDSLELCHGSTEWLMLFYVDRCKVLHFGYNNPRVNYNIDKTLLFTRTLERDL